MATSQITLETYIPGIACLWDEEAPGALSQSTEGTLLFLDISGFTNLSEKLAARGRIGSEELTAVLNNVFGHMLDLASQRGGSLLKYGGDALLLFFRSDNHVLQACAAAVELRAALRAASQVPTSVGRIPLKMSSGIHTGLVDFFLVGGSHRELIVTGPTVTVTTEMEAIAAAGEIVVSSAARSQLPASFTGDQRGSGWLLRKRKIDQPTLPATSRPSRLDEELMPFVPLGLRDRLLAGIRDPEHRIATVGFLGFAGVDELIEAEGTDHAARSLDQLVQAAQLAADDEGVTFLASDVAEDGGKIILIAGVPTKQSDDDGSILRAFRRILNTDSPLSLRGGVHRGPLFAGEIGSETRGTFTVIGDTVNLSARIMTAAPPGSLYASPSVLDRAATLFRTEPVGEFRVKGKDHPVRAFSVFEQTGIRPVETSREMPFAGRDAELQTLIGIVETCTHQGSGGMVTITGDGGSGKSRLVAEVLQRCPDLRTLTIQAEPNGVDNPYWAFRDPLRAELGIVRSTQSEMGSALESIIAESAPDLLPVLPLLGDVLQIDVPDNELTDAIDPKFRPDRTADAVIQLLAGDGSEQMAIIAEDGHWMDAASIGLLRRIGEEAETRRWTVIFTARLEGGDFVPLGREIGLEPLSDAAVRTISIQATAAAPLRPHELDRVVERSGGNPLFLAEILRTIRETGNADSLPESLEAVVSTEIDRLAPLPRQLIRYASVLGRSFRRVVFEELLTREDVTPDGATAVELSRFLDPDGPERMRFRHAMVHDIAYEGLSYRRRRELHRRAGEIIEEFAGEQPEQVAGFLAEHYSQSGVYDKAWRFARMAADEAKSAYATTSAVIHYRHAIEASKHLGDVSASEMRDVWTQLGTMQDLSGQFEAARAAYRSAIRVDRSDRLAKADLHLRQAEAWSRSGNYTQARRQITLGRSELKSLPPEATARQNARLCAFEASTQASSGDPAGAQRAANSAIDLATPIGEEEALARAYVVLDWSNFAMGRHEPRRGPEAVEILQRLGLHERSANVMNNMGAYAYLEGDWDSAIEWYERAVAAAERSGNVVEAAGTQANTAEVLVDQRKYQEAAALAADAERVFRASNTPQSLWNAELQAARAQAGMEEYATAVETMERLFREQLEAGTAYQAPQIVVYLSDVLVQIGQPEAAIERLDRFAGEAPQEATRVRSGMGRARSAALSALGDDDAAEAELSRALAMAVEDGDLLEEALLLEARGKVSGSEDSRDSARVAELHRQLGIATGSPDEATI